jgi:centrosomal protein CEP19
MSLENSFPDYQPKRFGVKFNPPMIVLEYLVPSTGKLYHHKMKLRDLTKSSDPYHYLEHIKRRHALYLSTSKVSDEQILGLIRKVQDNCMEDFSKLDLNKMTPEEAMKYKKKMDEAYKGHFKRPGDPGFQYDVEQNFEQNLEASWDEDEDF